MLEWYEIEGFLPQDKSQYGQWLPYMVLRCPLVRHDANQCRQLCRLRFGFGLCGRLIDLNSVPKEPSIYFPVSNKKAA